MRAAAGVDVVKRLLSARVSYKTAAVASPLPINLGTGKAFPFPKRSATRVGCDCDLVSFCVGNSRNDVLNWRLFDGGGGLIRHPRRHQLRQDETVLLLCSCNPH